MDRPEEVDSDQPESPEETSGEQESPPAAGGSESDHIAQDDVSEPQSSGVAESGKGEVIIETRSLTKVYRDFWGRSKVRAVKALDLQVRRGEIFGLLGPNGSGKSTTIKMLCGLLKPTRGSVQVAEVDLARHPLRAKAKLGYLPENPVLYDRLTGAEMLELFGALRKLSPKLLRQRSEYYAKALGLGDKLQTEVGTYSKGMRQKLGIAMTLVHDPEVVLLDLSLIHI